jgi:ABC-type multidrug transport system fused ATPase/permease subunit
LVKEVSYVYPDADTFSLDSLSFQITPGDLVAIVGPSGAGKSTLVDVILGIHTPQAGAVTISGVHPLEAISRWPGRISYVPQNCVSFEGTVRDNVAIALPYDQVSDEQVWSALQEARLAEVMLARDGLETILGEGGLRLSGGQRQRLGVARALYSRPSLLVLDEATSALDADTEASLTDTLRALAGKITIIVVAHRLATVRTADMVVYMNEGRLVASGTFNELRRLVPDFDRQATLLGLANEGPTSWES